MNRDLIGRWGQRIARVLIAVVALWIFLSAIAVMKNGADPLGELLQGSTLTDSYASTLGFGWLGAMLVLSGSPISVAAVALFDGGAVTAGQALTMITGSRLGAPFVVLTVSFAYALRRKGTRSDRRASVSIGIFALMLTAIVYLPALLIAIPLLGSSAIHRIQLTAPKSLLDITDTVTGTIANLADQIANDVPGLEFLLGVGILIASLRMVDLVLPEAAEAAPLDKDTDWRDHKWLMFGAGALVALVSMSVSVALTVLVPLVAKGYLRRRHVLPYIMGANITTLADTLFTALILDNARATQIVLAEVFAVSIVSVLLLAFGYTHLQLWLTSFTDWLLDSRKRITIYLVALVITPVCLILLVS